MDGTDDQVRIPVRFVNGEWQYLYGGRVPVRADAFGELIVHEGMIGDPSFLAKLKRQSLRQILRQGTQLMVALAVRPELPMRPELRQHLIPIDPMRAEISCDFFSGGRMMMTDFVRISIGELSAAQKRVGDFAEGGVWLVFEGARVKRIKSSQIIVPRAVSKEPLDSLNQALTRLSEVYESWRKSHTGSIYTNICVQDGDGKWFPLNALRETAIAEIESSLMVASDSRADQTVAHVARHSR